MPINGFVDLQRRSVQIGEIRIGTSVAVEGKDYRLPKRLDTFRFTTASEQAANAAAAKYGGQVRPWDQRKGRFEVITERTAIDVWVPPRGEAVDANMEAWDGPRCLVRCDGIMTSFPTRKPCMCPHPDDPADAADVDRAREERKRLAALRPPRACKPLTRINVSLDEMPGLLGVWRLNTGSENAAVETADSGDAMAIARAGGSYLPAVLRLEWRTRGADGKPYPVPVLQIGLSMRQLAEGALPAGPSGLLAQLQGAPPVARAAIASGEAPTVQGVVVPAARVPAPTAQQIAFMAIDAETRERVEQLAAIAKDNGLERHQVCIDEHADAGDPDAWVILRPYLLARWRELPEWRSS